VGNYSGTIIDGISITKTSRYNKVRISSKSQFFQNEKLIVQINGQYITFRKPHFDEDHCNRIYDLKCGWRGIDVQCDPSLLPTGKFAFEEIISEDHRTVYLGGDA